MSNIRPLNVAEFEQRLQAERRELLKQLEVSMHHAGASSCLALSGDAGEVGEVGEADERTEAKLLADTSIALRYHELLRVRAIDDALERIKGHAFGMCADCGEPIPAQRLNVDPATARCISCQERLERQHGEHHARF